LILDICRHTAWCSQPCTQCTSSLPATWEVCSGLCGALLSNSHAEIGWSPVQYRTEFNLCIIMNELLRQSDRWRHFGMRDVMLVVSAPSILLSDPMAAMHAVCVECLVRPIIPRTMSLALNLLLYLQVEKYLRYVG